MDSSPTLADQALPLAEQPAEQAGAEVERESVSPVAQSDPVDEALYNEALRRALERCKKYPRMAQRRGYQGVVHVEFVLRRDGKLLEARIIEGSGRAILDRAAMEALECLEAPPFYPTMIGETRRYQLPIVFTLR